MKKNLALLLSTCLSFIAALNAAETVFEGFGKPWTFYSGTKYSETKDEVSMPLKSGSQYIGAHLPLNAGIYQCSFEYKFEQTEKITPFFTFSFVADSSLNLPLTPYKEWTPVRLRIALVKDKTVKIGFGFDFKKTNRVNLKNFKLEKLGDGDFKSYEYPTDLKAADFWFRPGKDKKGTTLEAVSADDHVLGGGAIRLSAKKEFQGNLCLRSVFSALPFQGKYRAVFWAKSDVPGAVRAAISGTVKNYRLTTEWQKISFDFIRKPNAEANFNFFLDVLTPNIRSISVKNLTIGQME